MKKIKRVVRHRPAPSMERVFPVLKFMIELDQRTGQMQISGPIDDKMLCYAILESAKDAVREHHAERERKARGGLVIPVMPIPPMKPTG